MKHLVSAAALALLAVATTLPAMAQAPQGAQSTPPLPPLLLESNAFADGGIVPEKYAARGQSVQPDFRISNAPAGVASYAVIFHDIDVARGGNTDDVLHWIAWNIPGNTTQIAEGKLPEGSVVGKNVRGDNAYRGPGAPAGPRYHHYVFEFYALNARLDLPDTATRADLLAAMQGKVVAKAGYVGRYKGQ